MSFSTWAEDQGVSPPSRTLDRDRGEGPTPRCCATRYVTADSLVRVDRMDAGPVSRVRARFPQFVSGPIYLCGGCRETTRRERLATRLELPNRKRVAPPHDPPVG